jgi:hypothetical protein
MEEQVAEHREFLNAIQRSYAREKVVDLARKAGFSVTSERRTAEQEIVLEMTKW